jgi:hypothetical protein
MAMSPFGLYYQAYANHEKNRFPTVNFSSDQVKTSPPEVTSTRVTPLQGQTRITIVRVRKKSIPFLLWQSAEDTGKT